MKPRVNDPCPCGSGRKYKKCCLHRATPSGSFVPPMQSGLESALGSLLSPESGLASAALHMPPPKRPALDLAQHTSPSSSVLDAVGATTSLPWPPLPTGGKPFIGREDEVGWLRKPHIAFQTRISQSTNSPAEALQALQWLDGIPREEAMRLEWFGAAKAYLLELLARREEALFCQLEQLLSAQSDSLWLAWGMRGMQWLQTYPHAPQRQDVLDALEQTCANTNFVGPRLLWGFVQWEQNPASPSEEVIAGLQGALQAEAWPWRPMKQLRSESAQHAQGEWLAAIGDGLSRLLRHFHDRAASDALHQTAQQCHQFPWKQLHPKYRQHTLRALSGAMAHAGLHDDLLHLCHQFEARMQSSPVLQVWAGYAHDRLGDAVLATKYFQQAAKQPSQLTDAERICIIEQAFARQEPAGMLPLLQTLQGQSEPSVLRLYYWYHHLCQAHEEALSYLDEWLAKTPTAFEAICRRCRTLDILGHTNQLIHTLASMLTHTTKHLRLFAHVYLGIHRTMQGRMDEALGLFAQLPEEIETQVFLDDALFACSYWSCYGSVLEHAERWEESSVCYHRALSLHPMGWTFARFLTGLFKRSAWAEVDALLPMALEAAPEDFTLRSIQLERCLALDAPEEARQALELMGREPFVARSLQREWLWLWLQVLLALDSPREALQLSELHLDDILQDDALRRLRHHLFEEVMDQMEQLEAHSGQQEQLLQQSASLRTRLQQESEESQRRARALALVRQEQDTLREELHRLQTQAAPQEGEERDASELYMRDWQDTHQELLSRLQPNERKITCNAERLWFKLHTHPEDDHAAVVLQLARAVEGEINQRLLDPLVALALAQDKPISLFPSISLGRLKPSRNRVSLGDACKLLYHKRSYREPDGSITTSFNPGSQDAHKNLLASFWATTARASLPEETRRYCQDQLIDDTRKLATLRNKASHAGQPLPRTMVDAIRTLVLGRDDTPGILHHLALLP